MCPMQTLSAIAKFDTAKRIAYGVVYAPNVPDSQGDYMTADEIEKMAHAFLRKGFVNEIDTEHDLKNNGSAVVESFIARKGDTDFPEGAWVMGVHIPDDDLWAAVEKGEIGGFSMYGKAVREPRMIEIEVPDDGVLKGETADYDGHQHTYLLQFSLETGACLGGVTDEVAGHSHVIKKGTVTEPGGPDQHRHRFSFTEQLA